jgi:hypothetical protein
VPRPSSIVGSHPIAHGGISGEGRPRASRAAQSLSSDRSPHRSNRSLRIPGFTARKLDRRQASTGSSFGDTTMADVALDFGHSAVSFAGSAARALAMSVVAFPPRVATIGTGFPRPCGTTRPSDFSRPIAASSFRPRWLPAHAGGREISLGKTLKLLANAVSCTHVEHSHRSGFTSGAGSPSLRAPPRSFTCVRFGHSPSASTRRPSRGHPCLRIQVLGAPSWEDFHLRFQRHARRKPSTVLGASRLRAAVPPSREPARGGGTNVSVTSYVADRTQLNPPIPLGT